MTWRALGGAFVVAPARTPNVDHRNFFCRHKCSSGGAFGFKGCGSGGDRLWLRVGQADDYGCIDRKCRRLRSCDGSRFALGTEAQRT